MAPNWFETLTGFRETSYRDTQARFAVAKSRLASLVNDRSWAIGEFEMVSLAELRSQAAEVAPRRGRPTIRVIQGEAGQLHANPAYVGALFQVASQFNALEMTAPEITPEDGVTRYASDRTQGPACALAAAPATIYRNYLAPVGDGFGQTRARQLDGLADIGAAMSARLSLPIAELWTMQNGYALCSAPGLNAISAWLAQADPVELDDMRARLSIGLHRDVEVTAANAPPDHCVSQAFCSALPVAHTQSPAQAWAPFALLVLEAAYEATLLAAALQAARGGSNIVLLTLLGDGVFGNPRDWIFAAIRRAVAQAPVGDLDIRIVSYALPGPDLTNLVRSLA